VTSPGAGVQASRAERGVGAASCTIEFVTDSNDSHEVYPLALAPQALYRRFHPGAPRALTFGQPSRRVGQAFGSGGPRSAQHGLRLSY
jgi:hypothetical protein